ncbi:hypothetical protein IFM89_039209 [Coptis chinensis]|uniref:Uncharacterized protein n=1 Tax=Coptis chinensis TaxID=261450 RepID=A0A835IJX1_9MAGN|nr:hypothetical protein IFM89_039209 [Coptis chinensis]
MSQLEVLIRMSFLQMLTLPFKGKKTLKFTAHDGASSFKQMGLQEAKLLQLPTACNLVNANIGDCPSTYCIICLESFGFAWFQVQKEVFTMFNLRLSIHDSKDLVPSVVPKSIKWSEEEYNMKFVATKLYSDGALKIHMKYEGQSERLVSLEASVLESEKALNSVTEEKEQLQQELVKISALLEEKERADQIYQDLSSFKDQAI